MKIATALEPRPGMTILDLCAAPGGKTTHLAELIGDQGRIVACDRDARRLAPLTSTMQRLGLTSIEPTPIVGDEPPPGPFDAVLVDVPCSNTGVLGRRPEVRWRLTAAEIEKLGPLQAKLLAPALERTRPGGSDRLLDVQHRAGGERRARAPRDRRWFRNDRGGGDVEAGVAGRRRLLGEAAEDVILPPRSAHLHSRRRGVIIWYRSRPERTPPRAKLPSPRCAGRLDLLRPGRRRRSAGPHRSSVVSRRAGLLDLRAALRHAGRALRARRRRQADDRRAEGAGRLAVAQHALLPRRGGGRGPVGQGLHQGRDLRTREYWTGLFAHGFGLCGTTHAQWVAEMEALFGHDRGRGVGVAGHNSFEVFLTGGPYGEGKWVLLDHDLSHRHLRRRGHSRCCRSRRSATTGSG